MVKVLKNKRKEELRNKKIDKATMWGFAFGWVVANLIFAVFIIILFTEPFFQQDIDNILIAKSFKIVANSWESSEVVSSLTYLCSFKEKDIEQVNCVYEFLHTNMEWGYHDEGTNRLNKPDELFNMPCVCRDAAVLFKSVMNKLNIENDFVNEPGHIYNRVYLENTTCKIDIVNYISECN